VIQKVSTLTYCYLTVYDTANNPVTGLVNGDFTKLLAFNGANSGTPVTVTEIANGRYYASFTPATNGTWYLLVQQATYNPRGWDETITVTENGVLTVNELLDSPAEVDGYSLRETAQLTSAALCGKVSGMGAGSPVFRDMNDSANRIAALCDGDGNRTSVTLTP
jgi:hypothetical protein